MLSEAAYCARDAYSASMGFLLSMPYGFPWFTPEEEARISACHDELAAKYGNPEYNPYGGLQAGLLGTEEDRWQDRKDIYDVDVAAGNRSRSHWPFNYHDEDD